MIKALAEIKKICMKFMRSKKHYYDCPSCPFFVDNPNRKDDVQCMFSIAPYWWDIRKIRNRLKSKVAQHQ